MSKWLGTLPNYKTAIVTNPRFKCPDCSGKNVLENDIGGDVYEDYRYICKDCRETWVVEGADS